jgi:hypothetical protein
MTFVRTQKLHSLLPWSASGRLGRCWSALLWGMLGVGVCITLLSTLSLLPCASHCTQDEAGAEAVSLWFLCDLLGEPAQRALSEPPATHHHHAPRVAFEPLLVQLGLVAALFLVVSRLFVSAAHLALHPSSAPPTPPPRAA